MISRHEEAFLLESSSSLEDENFQQAVLLITGINENGATGFVINKLFHRSLNELEEFKHSISFPLYEGGPVEIEKLYFIHNRPDLIEEGQRIGDGIYLGGNFEQVIHYINSGELTTSHIKIFLGYCGWDAGQLEVEIEEGSWVDAKTHINDIFG